MEIEDTSGHAWKTKERKRRRVERNGQARLAIKEGARTECVA